MGLCCRSLKDEKILMKMGLGLVLAGHVNFLLGALMQGTVLRDVKVSTQFATLEYAITNIIALVAGLMAIIAGILAIVLSKNMKKQPLKWSLLVMSILAFLLGSASAVSVTVSMVMAISNSGLSLLTQCKLSGNISTYNTYRITDECPFDPTRIYGTTLILWVLLVMMSVVEVVFSGRCFVACTAFLRLACPWRKRPLNANRVRIRIPEDSVPASPVPPSFFGSPEEEEPTEEHDLLDAASPTEETSDWL
ncbi:transmembrane protein 54a isoform X2 [Salminus brasiliensis]|uniref:transmembrane protein 54a isoform X2 n=1 Tax=Salminus brasiliensis TaxID=930266 RepID=UPI003B82D4C2